MSAAIQRFDEKRNFIRMFVDAQVNIRDPHSGSMFTGESKNISGSGLLFQCDQFFEVGHILEVEVSSVQSKLAALKARFKINRIEKDQDGGYQVAGELFEMV